ncbi:MAG: hypothetical protein COA74_11705 [Gammaproteobacteria bacterium]|nr:MAG: hypothetical protein COA74_11705 [Gammaproteobacteria bacterium]
MQSSENLTAQVEQANKETSLFLNFIFLVSTIMSGIGLNAMLPSDDWLHYMQVFILSGAVFSCLKLIWTFQIRLFIPLASDKPSNTTIFAHLSAVMLTIFLSMPTTYTGMAWIISSEYDMSVHYNLAVDKGMDAKRNFFAVASIKSFVESQSEKMDEHAQTAKQGGYSAQAGEGQIYRTFKNAHDSLSQLVALIEQNREGFDSNVQRLGIAQNKMRHAIESEGLTLDEKVTAFEQAYREHADIYAQIMELDLARQIETSLNSFLDSALPPQKTKGNAKKALQLSQRQVRKVAGDIAQYVQAKAVVLRPISSYQLASPAVVSFRYAQQFWVQVALSAALDLSILIAVWMQIAALRKGRANSLTNNSNH